MVRVVAILLLTTVLPLAGCNGHRHDPSDDITDECFSIHLTLRKALKNDGNYPSEADFHLICSRSENAGRIYHYKMTFDVRPTYYEITLTPLDSTAPMKVPLIMKPDGGNGGTR